MDTLWILVANQSEAQIYSAPQLQGKLELVRTLSHQEGSARARDLTSDAPGRVHDRMGQARHSMEPGTPFKEVERLRFVKQILAYLEAAQSRGRFDRLVLLAAPAFLGVIRKNLSKKLAGAVTTEIAKDVAGQDPAHIQDQLRRAFEAD